MANAIQNKTTLKNQNFLIASFLIVISSLNGVWSFWSYCNRNILQITPWWRISDVYICIKK